MRLLSASAACLLGAAIACSSSPSAPDHAAPGDAGDVPDGAARDVTASVSFDEHGISTPVTFTIPPATRSVTVVVEGDPTRLYALAAFSTGDGVERVGIDTSASLAHEMRRRYFTEQSGMMPGELYQSIRLGTFTHVYPFAPGQAVAAGEASVRIISDGTSGSARVRVIMPPDDGARVLHVNLVRVSETAEIAREAPFVPDLRRVFAEAGIEVVVDEATTVRGTSFEAIRSFTEPQEAPDSDSAKLAGAVGPRTPGAALDVFVVDDLPSGVAGLSLGVPGPPMPESYYFGVVVAASPDAVMGRLIAHETAHFLGLQHVENRGVSGATYEDPIRDTRADGSNLMEDGTELTPGQAFVLSRSPLLVVK